MSNGRGHQEGIAADGVPVAFEANGAEGGVRRQVVDVGLPLGTIGELDLVAGDGHSGIPVACIRPVARGTQARPCSGCDGMCGLTCAADRGNDQ